MVYGKGSENLVTLQQTFLNRFKIMLSLFFLKF